ncbi:MAG TPA: SpoIIE family protein phosphatase [Terriglobales bacterium]|jgi:sigma-B regulation protein RsbU (phosphoserine phosphatase)|nr:SpoIIE family protein phosphatase [Terriglobales bacterium]
MRLIPLEIESKLREKGLWPESWTARAGIYVLALDIIFFAVQMLSGHVAPSIAGSLGGWVTFLSGLAIVLFAIVAFRWLRGQLLWRLRNRLIVTYVFIGVIPVILLVLITSITLYLFAGQFANFVVTSEIKTHLRSMEATNKAIAGELALQSAAGKGPTAESIAGMRSHDSDWTRRQVCAWYGDRPQPACSGPAGTTAFDAPFASLPEDFVGIVRERGILYLRASSVAKAKTEPLRVISSEALDLTLIDEIARELGEITLYGANEIPSTSSAAQSSASSAVAQIENEKKEGMMIGRDGKPVVTITTGNGKTLERSFVAGAVPAASGIFDRQISFGTPLSVIDWATGKEPNSGAIVTVQTRPSLLYERLFAEVGGFAKVVEDALLFIAIVFGIIELLALFIGTRLTRSITAAVAQLYEATKHINRADFSHRIQVKSNDQLATLANSFNSMTASIEKLVLDQKEKHRLESELAIAQEVQATLFPQRIAQLESLEVYGFCRPARTVSGDYYDFLALNSEKLILAVGDVSGKGISAALLMATIHSAVRAYSLEGVPTVREPMAVGVAGGADLMLTAELKGAEASSANLLGLLNHQLYESTPDAKYATMFLGLYDGADRRFTYTNAGHLPPILLSEDGTCQYLTCGGTVVGLFPDVQYPEATVHLKSGDIFIAYSDGVTEPENDYGEFGEERLLELVRENRHLPLARITEIVTAAVDDWIGDNEQPDDVTLVLARAR